jgi:cytoskeletal protein CcmA (bactofilin family)
MHANTVIVAGAVRGDITAERLEIRSTGKVWGNVVTGSFSTEEGAFLRGQITMEDKVDIGVIPEEEKAPEEKAPEEKTSEEKTSEEKAPEETPAEKSWITIQSDTGAETQEVNKQITKS